MAARPTPTLIQIEEREIGRSVNGLPITAHTVGTGEPVIALVGGIHGGYEWNTILLSYALLDHYRAQPSEDVTLIVIPSGNPDGQRLITGSDERFRMADVTMEDTAPGRFNGNGVDLNRNWACEWQPEARWRDRTVSGGTAAFSEPEAIALRDYLAAIRPNVTIFYHSAANGVFTGQCGDEQADETLRLSTLYADAAGYPLYSEWSAYPITGDASDYLNTLGLASFTVELVNQIDLDFDKNIAGVEAIIETVSSEQ